jgi:hypothetical protein
MLSAEGVKYINPKNNYFELPPGSCDRDENSRDRGRAEAVFWGQIPGNGEGGLFYGPFRPEGEF